MKKFLSVAKIKASCRKFLQKTEWHFILGSMRNVYPKLSLYGKDVICKNENTKLLILPFLNFARFLHLQ